MTIKTALIAGAALLAAAVPALAEWTPERPVEFIVASGAGGGTDNFARTIQAALTRNDILDQNMVVLNKGGGSGAEAFLYARQNAADPLLEYTIRTGYRRPCSSAILVRTGFPPASRR